MQDLPDFLKLDPEQIAAEADRQDRLRREFNSRARLSGVQIEFARALIIEKEIRKDLEADRPMVEKAQLSDRLAEVLAAQGRFIEASQTTPNSEQAEFYDKAARAIFDNEECDCGRKTVAGPNGTQLRLPKYREIRPVYSLKVGAFGHLLECNTCGMWMFSTSNPFPVLHEPKSDVELLG